MLATLALLLASCSQQVSGSFVCFHFFDTSQPSLSVLFATILTISHWDLIGQAGHFVSLIHCLHLPQVKISISISTLGPGYSTISFKLVSKICSGLLVDLADLLPGNLKVNKNETQTFLERKLVVPPSKKRSVGILIRVEAISISSLVLQFLPLQVP